MIAGGLGICIGVVFFFTAWPLNVNDLEALTSAASQAPFSVGHASAQLSFTGWLSKPMWRVVVFSSDEPPTQRGLVRINAVNKTIASVFFDRNDDDSPSQAVSRPASMPEHSEPKVSSLVANARSDEPSSSDRGD